MAKSCSQSAKNRLPNRFKEEWLRKGKIDLLPVGIPWGFQEASGILDGFGRDLGSPEALLKGRLGEAVRLSAIAHVKALVCYRKHFGKVGPYRFP